MLDVRNHQGKFGEDYIRVLASAAGLLVYQDDLDHDGIDLGIKLPGPATYSWSPRIEVQVKTTSRPKVRNGAFDFDGLNSAQFNQLAGPRYTVHRFLVLVVVPPRVDDLADLTTAGLLLRHVAYFAALRDRAPVDPAERKASIRVQVPLGNVLTVNVLRHLVDHPDRFRGVV